MCLGNNGVVNAGIFLPSRAVDLGVDKQTAAMLLSIVGACDFIGRVSGGCFADLGYGVDGYSMAIIIQCWIIGPLACIHWY